MAGNGWENTLAPFVGQCERRAKSDIGDIWSLNCRTNSDKPFAFGLSLWYLNLMVTFNVWHKNCLLSRMYFRIFSRAHCIRTSSLLLRIKSDLWKPPMQWGIYKICLSTVKRRCIFGGFCCEGGDRPRWLEVAATPATIPHATNQPAMRPPKILIGISGMRRTMAGERMFRPSLKLDNLHGA